MTAAKILSTTQNKLFISPFLWGEHSSLSANNQAGQDHCGFHRTQETDTTKCRIQGKTKKTTPFDTLLVINQPFCLSVIWMTVKYHNVQVQSTSPRRNFILIKPSKYSCNTSGQSKCSQPLSSF